ncbi:DUF2125 domain-containing protein [Roseibium algae]|uniref:DUF2125 domain-containing protein n=1 Tax=Roseibium algae TaxID=3123038 RepID=A0ABU8TL45_9HYPH
MQAGPKRNLRIRYIFLSAAVVLTIFAWSAGWFYMRGQLQNQIERNLNGLEQAGVAASCADLKIAGFPFRFEVSCDDTSIIDAVGRTSRLKRLLAVALVYNPWHVIIEAAGPYMFEAPEIGLKASADWKLARSSVLYSTDGLDQLDLAVDDLSLAALGAGVGVDLSAQSGQINLRIAPEDLTALEAFVSLTGVKSAMLPSDTSPIDGRIHLQVPNGAVLLKGRGLESLPGAEDGSWPLRLVWSSLKSDELQLEATGDLRLDHQGLLSGNVDLTVFDIEAFVQFLSELMPGQAQTFEAMKGAALSFGRQSQDEEDGRLKVLMPFTLSEGQVRLGLLPLGVLPPVNTGRR